MRWFASPGATDAYDSLAPHESCGMGAVVGGPAALPKPLALAEPPLWCSERQHGRGIVVENWSVISAYVCRSANRPARATRRHARRPADTRERMALAAGAPAARNAAGGAWCACVGRTADRLAVAKHGAGCGCDHAAQ